jgi:hypothetical protein
VYRKWEFRDTRWYDVLRGNLACKEMDLLRNGTQVYYRHRCLVCSE